MEKEWNLGQLKNNYKIFQEEYNLPSFEKLNEDFQIEKAAESETDFILREIRRCITDKFFNYLRFVESILTPVNAPMFVFAITKTIGTKDREKLMDALRKQKFTSISGPISHKPDGSGSIIPLPIQVQEGKFVSIYPPEVAEGKHNFPTPWK